jgi:type I restriction enzyme S subunit
LPPFSEQRRIASILSVFDDKIELNNQMNRTLEEMASTIFKSWFVDFEPFQDSEFEYNEEVEKEIPKGWEVKTVYSLADYINGMAFKMSDFAAEGLPIIKIAELNNGITDNTKSYNGEYKEKYFLKNGDVLFSWSASLGIYLWDGGDAILNQHIFTVKPKGTMTKTILYFLLKEMVNEFIQIAAFRATTMGHIKRVIYRRRKL